MFLTALALVGAGVGVAMAITDDVILAAVPAQRAGAGAAVAETAYELGAHPVPPSCKPASRPVGAG